MAKLHSKDLERACLAGCIQFPEKISDILPFIKSDDFYISANGSIFSVIANFVAEGKRSLDPILISERLSNIGITTVHDVGIGDYINAISKTEKIQEDSFHERFKELKKFSVLRNMDQTTEDLKKIVNGNLEKPIGEVVSMLEDRFGDGVDVFQPDHGPVNLFEKLEPFIEERGNHPEDCGIKAPYSWFRKLYGDFLKGGLYVFCAPPKAGKSTFLMDICDKVTDVDEDVVALYLDTELTSEEVMLRLAFRLTGVNEFYLRNGAWRKNPQMEETIRGGLKKIKETRNKNVDHLYVANKPITEIISLVRRWHYQNAKDGKKVIIFYDYLKLTGEKVSEHWKEHQVMGDKATKLKDLAQELKAPIISAVQANASGSIAMSNAIKWFVNMLAMLKPKSPEEIAEHGIEFGTHTLKVTESRNQGENGMGFIDLVKMPNGDFQNIDLHFEFKDFKVKELCTLREVVTHMESSVNLPKNNNNSGNF